MERTGWKATIYDIDWARFKSGQEGLIIYKNGVECETLFDYVNKVIVEASPNTSTTSTKVGHILFKQKGSDKQSIVCISLGKGKIVYSIQADNDNIEISTCELKHVYNNDIERVILEKNLKIFLYANGEKYSNEDVKGQCTISINPSIGNDIIDGNYEVTFEYSNLELEIERVTTKVNLKITYNDDDITIDNDKSRIVEIKSALTLSSLVISSNVSSLVCGGEVQYNLEKYYELKLDVDAEYAYNRCGELIDNIEDVPQEKRKDPVIKVDKNSIISQPENVIKNLEVNELTLTFYTVGLAKISFSIDVCLESTNKREKINVTLNE